MSKSKGQGDRRMTSCSTWFMDSFFGPVLVFAELNLGLGAGAGRDWLRGRRAEAASLGDGLNLLK